MDIKLSEGVMGCVARYHLLMMVATALEHHGLKREARDLLSVTKGVRTDMADAIIHALVDSLAMQQEYYRLFRCEEDKLYGNILSELDVAAPLQ